MTDVTLADCPSGLFQTPEGHWGFKTEYAHKSERDGRYYPDAYVVASGEFFWGGVNTHPERANLIVRPIPDPAAYVAAFDGMVGALEIALPLLASCGYPKTVDALNTALTAARLARGGE